MSPREPRDGCQCYPWTLRCVHWDGHVLSLLDESSPTPEEMKACHGSGMGKGFTVHYSRDMDQLCECGFRLGGPPLFQPTFDALPAADAEFERRAEELRHLDR